MGNHGKAKSHRSSKSLSTKIRDLLRKVSDLRITFFKKPLEPVSCSWCGETEDIAPINAYEFESKEPIYVCLNVVDCYNRYWGNMS